MNISESLDDEEENTSYNSRNTKLGQPSTRQSWHGHTPTRSYPRQNLTNTATTQGKRLPRYSLPSRLAHQQGCQLDKPVHAKLISVNNHQNRMHTHWSTGSLQQPAWEKPRLLSDSTVPNRPRRITSMKSNGHPPSFERNVSDNKMINSGRAPAPAVPLNSGRRRSPPDYLTAVKQSKGKYSKIFFKNMSRTCFLNYLIQKESNLAIVLFAFSREQAQQPCSVFQN